jgi:hypothetical protein
MAVPAGNVYVNLSANSVDFNRKMKTAEESVKSFKAKSNRAMAQFQRKLRDVRKGLFSWQAAAGAAAGAAGMGLLIDRTLESAQQLDKFSKATGFGVERVQELQFAAQQAGVQQDRLRDALGELSQRMGEAAADGGEMAEGFKSAGIAIDGLASRRPGEVFDQVADAIANAETKSKALNIAVKVFGDEAGREMVAVARRGSDGLDDMAAKARELGLVLSQETVQGGAQAARELDKLKQVLSAQFTKAVADLGPDITEFTSQLANNTDKIKTMAEAMLELAQATGTVVSTVVGGTQSMAVELAEATGSNIERSPEVKSQIQGRLESRLQERSRLQGLLANPGATPENVLGGYRDRLKQINREIQNYREFLGRAAEKEKEAKLTSGGSGGGNFGGLFGAGAVTDPTAPGNIDVTGIFDMQAARERADQFDKIWAKTVRSQQAMQDEVARENAEAYRTLDQEWNKAVRQQQALEDQSKETADVMADAFDGWANRFSSTLTDTIFDAEKDLKDFANTMVETFARMGTQAFIQQGIQGLASGIGAGSSGGTGLGQGPGGYSLEGFADGGSFTVGSSFPSINAGRDNRLVAFAARDGERVSVTPSGGGGGAPQINQTITVQGNGDVDLAAVREAARQGAEGGYRKAIDDARRGGPLRKAMNS